MQYIKLLREERNKKELRNLTSLQSDSEKAPINNKIEESFSKPFSFKQPKEIELSNFILDTLPNSYYIPEYISNIEEEFLISSIDNLKWVQLNTRKLQLWGKAPDSNESSEFPYWLQNISESLVEQNIFPAEIQPNSALINKYESFEGIMHHTDGPLYYSRVAILSLNTECLMTFKPKLSSQDIGIKECSDVLSVLLKPRSLFIFSDTLYNEYMHGIYSDQDIIHLSQFPPVSNSHLIDLPVDNIVSLRYIYFLS